MLKIKISKKGAELTSIKLDEKEMLHNGKTFWKRQSPILFPMVGKLKGNETIINDKKYNIPQHGFAKDMMFEKVEEKNNKYTYVTKSNYETLKIYPFEFKLYITYKINDNKLIIKYKVINCGNEIMLFGIGGHPGFKIDVENEKYYFELEKEENNIVFMEVDGDQISNKPAKNILENKKIIRITKDSFINDAIMIKNYESKKITLKKESNNKKVLTFDFGNFPILGIWSIPGASFICVEPWFNTADKVFETGYFKSKEGIISLDSKKEFNSKYSIEFFK